MSRMDDFEKELEGLLNKYNTERDGGDTPDFILARYLRQCLEAFGEAVIARRNWWGPEKEKTS